MSQTDFRKCDVVGCARQLCKVRSGRDGITLSKEQMLEGLGVRRSASNMPHFIATCATHNGTTFVCVAPPKVLHSTMISAASSIAPFRARLCSGQDTSSPSGIPRL